jgi:hypothetical protein
VHWRFYELAVAGPAPIASEALRRPPNSTEIEDDIHRRSAEQRRATRQEKSRPIVVDLEPWLRKNSGLASQKTKLANADPPHHRREPEAAAPGPHRSALPTLVPDFAPNDAGLRPSPATNLHINACRFAVEHILTGSDRRHFPVRHPPRPCIDWERYRSGVQTKLTTAEGHSVPIILVERGPGGGRASCPSRSTARSTGSPARAYGVRMQSYRMTSCLHEFPL